MFGIDHWLKDKADKVEATYDNVKDEVNREVSDVKDEVNRGVNNVKNEVTDWGESVPDRLDAWADNELGPIGDTATRIYQSGEDFYDGITGEAAIKAAEEAAAKAAEEARLQRVSNAKGRQFAERDAKQVGANVSLGTANTDKSLEEQLRRMRGGSR